MVLQFKATLPAYCPERANRLLEIPAETVFNWLGKDFLCRLHTSNLFAQVYTVQLGYPLSFLAVFNINLIQYGPDILPQHTP